MKIKENDPIGRSIYPAELNLKLKLKFTSRRAALKKLGVCKL